MKVAQSLALREQYESHVAELRSCLEQCRADIGAVDVPGVTVATKMARYQVPSSESLCCRRTAVNVKVPVFKSFWFIIIIIIPDLFYMD